jgi:hypothetical protein
MTEPMPGCDECEFGWRYADDAYVAKRIPMPDDATPEQEAHVLRQRALYPDHTFPCDNCRPEAFRAWANGCWSPGHNRAACDLCAPSKAGHHG